MNYIIKGLILSICSGLLIYFAWPVNGIFPLIFFGLVPLLIGLEIVIKNHRKLLYLKSFLLFFTFYFIWTLLSLTWLYKTAPDSYLITSLLTTINYSVILSFYPMVYIKLGKNYALAYFASAILLTDWISQVYSLGTPYFNLGLGLGQTPWLIQHYKIIGVEGGSLWIILSNIFIFNLISNKNYFSIKKWTPIIGLVIIVPIISVITFSIPENSNENTLVAIHHSNIDPNTKEAYENPIPVIDSLFNSTFSGLKKVPDIIVWPETIIIRLGWLHKIDTEPVIVHLKEKLKNYPNTTLVFGAIGFSHADSKKEITRYTTYVEDGNYYFNTHNLAVTVTANLPTLITSKELFIPFHEQIPYYNTLPFLANLIDALGTRAMFSPFKGGNKLTQDLKGHHYESVLCYESLFSLFMIKKCTRKIGAILIHANEHWLKDLNGSKQYLYENVAIAIQGGKPLIRSSNGGATAVISKKGEILDVISGDAPSTILKKVSLNYSTTFYSHIAGSFHTGGGISSILLLFISIIKRQQKK
ncbi:MAG: apolipoprotein N-acyltransferase [Flavobacteriales bacterium]|nr:apolipoprotein N-acyltransferase [Flavobacteriales bacterium]MCB9336183.1 apolipoprotein N-acyltransferase [Flavobacteriales bacterium]